MKAHKLSLPIFLFAFPIFCLFVSFEAEGNQQISYLTPDTCKEFCPSHENFDLNYAQNMPDGVLFVSKSGELIKLCNNPKVYYTSGRYYWYCCQCGWANRYYDKPCEDGYYDGTRPRCYHKNCPNCVSKYVPGDDE